MKLDIAQKHVLSLIARDKKEDGWTRVSQLLYKPLSESIPKELAVFELVGNDGWGRAKLTEAGSNVVEAMSWL